MKKILIILLLLTNLCACSNGSNTSLKGVKESSLYGVKTYTYNDYNIPQVFGIPTLTDEEVNELADKDDLLITSTVTSYIDLLRIDSLRSYSNKLDYSDIYRWASSIYDNVGLIYTEILNEYNKCINSYVVYIIVDDYYYVLNISKDTSNKEWLKYNNVESAVVSVSDDFERWFIDNSSTNYYLVKLYNPDDSVIFENGQCSATSISRNTLCYEYYGYKIPVGLGMPKLSKSEIIDLTKTTDYQLIRDSIDNIGDAVAFIKELGIEIEPDGTPISFKGGTIVDIGNVYFDGDHGMGQSSSAVKIIKKKSAQCTASATLLTFLLYGDYDEFCYVLIMGNDGHAFNYAKGFDGRYYIIDASLIIGSGIKPWNLHFSIDGNADTLEELMVDLSNSNPPWGGGGIHTCVSWSYDGVWAYGGLGSELSKVMDEIIFPKGVTNINIWKGPKAYSFYDNVTPKDQFYTDY